jgi:general secretion pathway protein M
MAMQPTRRDRWLALVLLLAVLAAAYAVLVHPWFTRPLLDINRDIAELQERQQRVDAQLQQRDAVNQRLQDVQAALANRPGFLREATTESAAAALSSRLQDAVASASPGNRSCVISNRSPLADTARDATFPRVALQVRLRCGVPEMAAVLHTLETGSPRLFVGNLNLLAQRFQQSPNESGLGLDVSFELVGYLQPGLSGDGPAAPLSATVPAPEPTGLEPAGLEPTAAGPGASMAAPTDPAAADAAASEPVEEAPHEN